jgi:hypothetical protein
MEGQASVFQDTIPSTELAGAALMFFQAASEPS